MVGGDMPGWLPSLFRRAGATALTDRRANASMPAARITGAASSSARRRASQDADWSSPIMLW